MPVLSPPTQQEIRDRQANRGDVRLGAYEEFQDLAPKVHVARVEVAVGREKPDLEEAERVVAAMGAGNEAMKKSARVAKVKIYRKLSERGQSLEEKDPEKAKEYKGKAAHTLLKIIPKDESTVDQLENIGDLLALTGQWRDAAEKCYEPALRAARKDPAICETKIKELHEKLFVCHEKQEPFVVTPDPVRLLEEWANDSPADRGAPPVEKARIAARVFEKTGKLDEALRGYQALNAALAPEEVRYFENKLDLARIRIAKGHRKEAAEIILFTFRMRPGMGSPEIRARFARALRGIAAEEPDLDRKGEYLRKASEIAGPDA